MALVPKLPDLSQSTTKLFEATIRSENKAATRNQLFPKLTDNLNLRINYSSRDN